MLTVIPTRGIGPIGSQEERRFEIFSSRLTSGGELSTGESGGQEAPPGEGGDQLPERLFGFHADADGMKMEVGGRPAEWWSDSSEAAPGGTVVPSTALAVVVSGDRGLW